jgi:serine/threonine protein kinase
MRATKDRLAEKYIVIVARELAKALKGLHAAGIIHRDIKAANVLIHEEGKLQLCDFGVANVLDTRTDKRRTFIGTLHWMPPELWTERPEYSDEVDVWEYGCTLYECALGRPPNSDLRERQQLKMRMRRLKQAISLPESENFSTGLRDLVKFALSPEVTSRPSMKDILEHDLLRETEETHPTKDLSELVQTYYGWLFTGGQRVSLFIPGGAPAAATEDPDSGITDSDEWNFSTTQDFERRVSTILEIPDISDLAANFEDQETPRGLPQISELSPPRQLTAAQKANFEARVNRGAADLSNLFDQSGPAYEFKTKTDFIPVPELPTPEKRRISDLPFRAMAEDSDRPTSIASNVIDLGDFDDAGYAPVAPRTDDNIQTTYADNTAKEQTIRLADVATLRQKRADSKGPRDSNSQNLTAQRAHSADDVGRVSMGVAAQDFAAAQQDWEPMKDKGKQVELQEAAEIVSSNPARATMDWSFADAMAGMGSAVREPEVPLSAPLPASEVTPTNIPQSAVSDEPGPEEELPSRNDRATLDWSFSDAMSELQTSGPVETASPGATRTTPSRPHPLVRQMTMPVTNQDFSTLEEDDTSHQPIRPATSLSGANPDMADLAYPDSDASSADFDPFAFETSNDDDYILGAHTLDTQGPRGIGDFYATRGQTILPNVPWPEPFVPTSGGVAFPYGRPPRVGEEGFPGPGPAAAMPAGARNMPPQHERGSAGGSGGSARGGTNAAARLVAEERGGAAAERASAQQMAQNNGFPGFPASVEVPEVAPPSVAALSAGATNEELAAELERLLEGFGETLAVASSVFGSVGGRRGRGRERGARRGGRGGGGAAAGGGSGGSGSGGVGGAGAGAAAGDGGGEITAAE